MTDAILAELRSIALLEIPSLLQSCRLDPRQKPIADLEPQVYHNQPQPRQFLMAPNLRPVHMFFNPPAKPAAGSIYRPDPVRAPVDVRLDVPRADTARLESARLDVPRAESVRLDVARAESVRLDVPRAESVRLDVPRADTARLDVPRAESVRLDVPRGDSVRLDVPRAESVGLAEPVKVDSPKTEFVRSQVSMLEKGPKPINIDKWIKRASEGIWVIKLGLKPRIQRKFVKVLDGHLTYDTTVLNVKMSSSVDIPLDKLQRIDYGMMTRSAALMPDFAPWRCVSLFTSDRSYDFITTDDETTEALLLAVSKYATNAIGRVVTHTAFIFKRALCRDEKQRNKRGLPRLGIMANLALQEKREEQGQSGPNTTAPSLIRMSTNI